MHAFGATSPEQQTLATSLVQRFIGALRRAAVDKSHVAARYANLLDRLWFRYETDSETTVVDSLAPLGTDLARRQRAYDDAGLPPFDSTETLDLFVLPPVFAWDQCGFLGFA